MIQLSFGQRLRKIRLEKGLSLKPASELIGIDYTTLSKIEKEERYPYIQSVKAYADAFEVDYKELQVHYLTEQMGSLDCVKDAQLESIQRIEF